MVPKSFKSQQKVIDNLKRLHSKSTARTQHPSKFSGNKSGERSFLIFFQFIPSPNVCHVIKDSLRDGVSHSKSEFNISTSASGDIVYLNCQVTSQSTKLKYYATLWTEVPNEK